MKTAIYERHLQSDHSSEPDLFSELDRPVEIVTAPVQIPPRDHSRGRDSEPSKRAFEKIHSNSNRQKAYDLILDLIERSNGYGLTSKEYVLYFNANLPWQTEKLLPLHGATPRFSELRDEQGKIVQVQEVRDGCGIWILVNGTYNPSAPVPVWLVKARLGKSEHE